MLAAILCSRGVQPTPPVAGVDHDGWRRRIRIEQQRQIEEQFAAQDDEDVIATIQAIARKR